MAKKLPIFYSALLLTGVNLLLRFAGTAFQVYLSGTIGAEGVGLLQLVLSVGTMAMVAGTAGIRTATMYLTAEELGRRKPENVTWALSGCIYYSLLCSGAVALALYILAPNLATGWIGDGRTADALRLYAAFLPVSCLAGVMVGYFTGASRIGTLAAVEVAEQLCSMLCTVTLLILWAGNDPQRASMAVILGSSLGACLTLICLVILRCKHAPPKSRRLPIRHRLVQTAVPLALADDLRTGISTLENLMVPKRLALYSGIASPLAVFGMICGMVFPLLMFPVAILFGLTELLIPELARCNVAGSNGRIRHLVRKSLLVAMLYGTICGGILFLCAEDLCLGLYGSAQAGKFLRMFSLLTAMLYCDAVTDAMIKGLGEQKASVRYNILTNSMDVGLLYILLPRYGIMGYYFSFVVTHAINFRLSIGRLLKITKLNLPLRLPILTLLAAALSIWASSYVTQPFQRAAAYVLILISLLFLLRVLKKEDILWMKGLIYKK